MRRPALALFLGLAFLVSGPATADPATPLVIGTGSVLSGRVGIFYPGSETDPHFRELRELTARIAATTGLRVDVRHGEMATQRTVAEPLVVCSAAPSIHDAILPRRMAERGWGRSFCSGSLTRCRRS